MSRILVVDDERNIRATVARALMLEGYQVGEAEDGEAALTRLDGGGYALAIFDLSMPRRDGLETLRELRARGDTTPVIILTAHGTIDTAVEALRNGAYDFLEKPLDRDHLVSSVARALEHARLRREVDELRVEVGRDVDMVGTGPLMDALRETIALAAPSDGRVLITGENGTGKELVARALHDQSPRRRREFVKVNCAAVPETLFESELFGHLKGAFTGATENRKGKFEQAHRGTLFLDEVGEIPLHLQPKLLRAIETGEVQRVGGRSEFEVDVRIVAATNRDLEREVSEGRFREDLYYRLDVVPIRVPPLRERKQDIGALAERFLAACCARNGFSPKSFDPEATRVLGAHDYPGNVRELRNTVERLAILTRGEAIGADDIRRILAAGRASGRAGAGEGTLGGGTLREQVEAFERATIQRALEQHEGRMAETARALGLERSHLYKKLKALGIERQGGGSGSPGGPPRSAHT